MFSRLTRDAAGSGVGRSQKARGFVLSVMSSSIDYPPTTEVKATNRNVSLASRFLRTRTHRFCALLQSYYPGSVLGGVTPLLPGKYATANLLHASSVQGQQTQRAPPASLRFLFRS